MDRGQIDRLARALARRQGRRAALRATLGLGGLALGGRRAEAAVSRAPGEPCHRDAQCVWDYGQEHVCADNGIEWDGATNCCTFAGNFCASDAACCGGMFCIEGTCRYWSSLDHAGKTCWDGSECGGIESGLICDYTEWTVGRVCCGQEGHVCQHDGHCCWSLRCVGGWCG